MIVATIDISPALDDMGHEIKVEPAFDTNFVRFVLVYCFAVLDATYCLQAAERF